ncbi:MAG: EscU/YscU/HrcU family type III secretion system export apparatus switch protein [Acidobacteria bacterium]|nr:EscU/YscU/HrcU family type III secretion system export apparatus switch protein [Acidobacteriota bacterium]
MATDRTEPPSGKRLGDLRKKGQLPLSKDLLQAASFLAAVMVLSGLGSSMAGTLKGAVKHSLVRVGTSPLAPIDGSTIGQMVIDAVVQLVLICGPLACASALSVVAVQVASQKGFVLATEAITFNWGSLNPANGIKRLGLSQGGYELLKAIVVSAALVTIGWQTIHAFVMNGATLARIGVAPAVAAGWEIAMGMFWKVAVVLLALGAADYGYQRWRFKRNNRMTKQEVKDENRQSEGNPETRGRIRRIQRMMFRQRMMAAVPRATVVITNPTHFAMALEYHRGTMPAPRVLAKGKNLVAQRIKAIAREHGVPIVENPPLAQALYKSVDVGDLIPGSLFDAVAEVLAYLIRLKQLIL